VFRVCSDAVLRLLGHKEEDVDVTYLYSFAVANLVVDVICTWLFYVRRQDVFLQPSKVEPGKEGEHGDDTSMGMYDLEDVEIVLCADYNDDSEQKDFSFDGKGNSAHLLKTKNLNMISAFTHVGGDTLRSFTVLLAAMVSSTFDIDATLTDAVAAIVVSVTIVVAVMPLMYSLGVTILDYKVRFKAAKENNKNYRGLKTESEDESSTHALNDQSNSNSSSSLSSGDKVYTTTGKISPKKSSAHKLRPGEIDKDEDEITL
jgi:Co/Zn/Cd efflux system component